MAFSAETMSVTLVSVDQSLHTVINRFRVKTKQSTVGATVDYKVLTYVDGVLESTTTIATWVSDGSEHDETGNVTLSYADEAGYSWKAQAVSSIDGTKNGSLKYFKSAAVTATASAPSSSSVSYTTATVACNFYPNTLDSTVSVKMQYKRTSDSTWTDGASQASTTGYAQDTTLSTNLTGLTAGTSYDFRMSMTRTTANETSLTSSTGSFNTLTAAPAVTTAAATSVGTATAQLNGTVAINGATGVNVYWEWDTINPPSAVNPNYGSSTPQSAASDGSYNTIATGLSTNTLYYFRAAITWFPDGYSAGSVLNFTTLSGPPAGSDEDQMITQYVDAIYGNTVDVYFTLREPSGTSSNDFYTGTAPVNTTDSEVWIDGTSDGALDNAISRLAGSVVGNIVYKTTVSATQTSGDVIDIIIKDATASEAFRDHHIQIRTKQNLSQIVVDASNKTNTTAVAYTGVGSGHGLSCVSGATGNDINGILGSMVQRESTCQAGSAAGTIVLDASASATNDYYNGALVLVYAGTGSGQARVITDYVGASQTCTVNKNWATTPDNTSKFIIFPGDDPWNVKSAAQLASLPTVTSNYADMLQFVFQRFALKRTQTATEFKSYKSDGTTALGTGSVTDDGTTQTHGALS